MEKSNIFRFASAFSFVFVVIVTVGTVGTVLHVFVACIVIVVAFGWSSLSTHLSLAQNGRQIGGSIRRLIVYYNI